MANSVRFNNAIDALAKGYLNGTLAKGSCSACAVGNMVARGCGYDIKPDTTLFGSKKFFWENQSTRWEEVFITDSDTGEQIMRPDNYELDAKKQIDATGYSVDELASVESTFERATLINIWDYHKRSPEEIDADQYAGLVAVFAVLCKIEGIADPSPYTALLEKEAIV